MDGALGSRTAALFDPYTCGPASQTGIPRLSPRSWTAIIAGGRAAGIGLAIHAIGDRGVADVLDAFERAAPRAADSVPDRIEHLQLMRPADLPRLAAMDITASMQPVHCAADRPMVEACWADRLADAYPVAALRRAGAAARRSGRTHRSKRTTRGSGSSPPCIDAFRRDGTPDVAGRSRRSALEAALSAYTLAIRRSGRTER